MRLEEAIAGIERFGDDAIIAVKTSVVWNGGGRGDRAGQATGRASVSESKAAGFEYFLEVHVAREVLAVFGANPRALDEKVRLLMHYAEHDAYPEWVYT